MPVLKFNRAAYEEGVRYERNQIAEVSDSAAALLTSTIVDDQPIAVEVDPEALAAEAEVEEEGFEWDIEMTPNEYLAAHPNGPKADLAKELVEMGFGDGQEEVEEDA